ncbi:ferritin light chain-like isoform X2 [Sphaerodactylus townsendi]|uniref:ferritin light chain-like isoform X2 n=1 Tax=Sphaerodactylus townsendi TaxID=933632 RepID=UPI0020261DDE|nr:ferritin light chain-like isoform X2 [Sphaerodactylus townsendi]
MGEPRPKRFKSGLPLCTGHRHGRAPGKLVKQNFPPVVEEGLCGVASALLEVSYVFQMMAKEERGAAEVLIHYLHDRGGLYCTRTIQKPPNVHINDVAAALEVALIQCKMLAGYFEDLYALSIKNSDPHTASMIKKQFLAPKIQKIKLMRDLITNAHRLRSDQDGRGDLENYLIDRLQKELRIEPDSDSHCSPCTPLQRCAGTAKGMQRCVQRSSHSRITTKS